jgi:uncharacterized phage-associated protein
MLVDFQWAAWHYIPKDRTLYNHCRENLKSYIFNDVYLKNTIVKNISVKFFEPKINNIAEEGYLNIQKQLV